MNLEVKIPYISETITEIILSKWLKKDGNFVEKDEAICELETEKATMELSADVSGVLHIKQTEINIKLKTGTIIAMIERTISDRLKLNPLTTKIVEVIHYLHQKGWSPATSTNYSFLTEIPFENNEAIAISKSGIDKSKFTVNDFMLIDPKGNPLPEFQAFKSSAETLLHTLIYQKTDARVILHTHSQFATILSQYFFRTQKIIFEGYEVLKGLDDITTHQTRVAIPIFENSQDMESLSNTIENFWRINQTMQGFLLTGHGLYAWGKDLKTAKRKLEVIEFLLECEYYKLAFKNR